MNFNQLVEHRTGIAEVTGSNLIFFQASSYQQIESLNQIEQNLL